MEEGLSKVDAVVEEALRQQLLTSRTRANVLLDPAGQIISWNDGAQSLLGYQPEEVLGRHLSLLHGEHARRVQQVREDLVQAAHRGCIEFEDWLHRCDGANVWTLQYIAALRDPAGQLVGFLCVFTDLTRRRKEELFLRSIVDHAQDGIICIDSHGRIQSFNTTAEQIFGYTEIEMLGQDIGRLMPEPHHREHQGYIEHYLRTGETRVIGHTRELTGLRQDGSIFPLVLAVSEFEMDGQRFFTGVIHDISGRRRLEQQFQQSQKMEAIGQLAGGVAHDFNNLLTVILGYTQLMLGDLPAEHPHREMLGIIRQSGERAALLTSQLLAFSRRQVLQPRLLNLNQVVQETEKMLRRLIGEDISVETVLEPELAQVEIDPGQFMQVLMNLAVNSRDAMPTGGKLTVKTANFVVDAERAALMPEYTPGPHVLLSFSDNGQGMPAEVRSRIFEPFFTTKEPGHGTGLGLSTVYGIIKQSGGNIEVYSEIGIGTTFKIYLPAAPGAAVQAAQARADAVPAPAGGERVLLVEDEDAVRLIALLVLEAQGYFVLDAPDAEAAQAIFREREGQIDLLVTDLVMPGTNGRELAEALQALRPGLPVLFMSGYTDDAVVRHGLLHQDVEFLTKPFTPTQLCQRVREVLDKAQTPDSRDEST